MLRLFVKCGTIFGVVSPFYVRGAPSRGEFPHFNSIFGLEFVGPYVDTLLLSVCGFFGETS